MQEPPVEMVGFRPVQISSKSRMMAASSTIRSDRASERPASSDVGMATIWEPLLKLIACLVGSYFGINSHLGMLSRMTLTFLIMFIAVGSLVAMMRMFLSL